MSKDDLNEDEVKIPQREEHVSLSPSALSGRCSGNKDNKQKHTETTVRVNSVEFP